MKKYKIILLDSDKQEIVEKTGEVLYDKLEANKLVYSLNKTLPNKEQRYKTKMVELYKLKKTYKDRESIVEGTLQDLINYFSYTLEIGHSWNKKIQKQPKNISSFLRNLHDSFSEKEAACYGRTFVELVY